MKSAANLFRQMFDPGFMDQTILLEYPICTQKSLREAMNYFKASLRKRVGGSVGIPNTMVSGYQRYGSGYTCAKGGPSLNPTTRYFKYRVVGTMLVEGAPHQSLSLLVVSSCQRGLASSQRQWGGMRMPVKAGSASGRSLATCSAICPHIYETG